MGQMKERFEKRVMQVEISAWGESFPTRYARSVLPMMVFCVSR